MMQAITITTLENQFHFQVPLTINGRQLFDYVCRVLGYRELHWFGLQYKDVHGRSRWQRLDKRLLSPSGVYHLACKYYPAEAADLLQYCTKRAFYLQIKHEIFKGLHSISSRVLLAKVCACFAQEEYGDYTQYIKTNGNSAIVDLSQVEELEITTSEYSRFIPGLAAMRQDFVATLLPLISEEHRALYGMEKEDVVSLCLSLTLPRYGVTSNDDIASFSGVETIGRFNFEACIAEPEQSRQIQNYLLGRKTSVISGDDGGIGGPSSSSNAANYTESQSISKSRSMVGLNVNSSISSTSLSRGPLMVRSHNFFGSSSNLRMTQLLTVSLCSAGLQLQMSVGDEDELRSLTISWRLVLDITMQKRAHEVKIGLGKPADSEKDPNFDLLRLVTALKRLKLRLRSAHEAELLYDMSIGTYNIVHKAHQSQQPMAGNTSNSLQLDLMSEDGLARHPNKPSSSIVGDGGTRPDILQLRMESDQLASDRLQRSVRLRVETERRKVAESRAIAFAKQCEELRTALSRAEEINRLQRNRSELDERQLAHMRDELVSYATERQRIERALQRPPTSESRPPTWPQAYLHRVMGPTQAPSIPVSMPAVPVPMSTGEGPGCSGGSKAIDIGVKDDVCDSSLGGEQDDTYAMPLKLSSRVDPSSAAQDAPQSTKFCGDGS